MPNAIITTYTGREIDLFQFNANDVCVQDIANALAKLCRYNGHTEQFYSVAQHSVHVSLACPKEHKLWGLMHDAAEIYIGDMVRPLKERISLFSGLETRIMCRVAHRFGMEWPMPAEVEAADDYVLNWELYYFNRQTAPSPSVGWQQARDMWMQHYKVVTEGGGCPCGCSI